MKRPTVKAQGFSVSNNLLKISTFLLIFLLGWSYTADAQKRTKKKSDVDEYFDEGGFGSHRFWYGGGVGLGFSGGNVQSQFNFSVSPMVGYKITPELSIGPRLELDYAHVRVSTGQSSSDKFNIFNYGIGGFARYKIFQQFFIHGEYQIESRGNPISGTRGSRDNFYVGAGYSSGGSLIGYEISLLWNLLEEGTVDLPLDYRVAFTYNF